MGRIAEYLEHPGHFLSDAGHTITHRKSAVSGFVMALLGIALFISMWPELKRYIKIKRM